MVKLITKRNVTILNLALAVIFLVTLSVVAIPFLKKEPIPSLFSDEPARKPKISPSQPKPQEIQEIYVCPKHPEVTSSSPGKCPQCGSELEKVDRFAGIVKRDLFFDPRLRPPPVVKVTPPPPLQWELAGVTKVGVDYVAIIRDKSKRVGRGYKEYMVKEGEDVPGYFGVTIVSITPSPPSVKYDRAGVGEEELKMGERAPAVAGKSSQQWVEIIRPMRVGYTYVVKLPELQKRIATVADYRGTFGLEPSMQGTRGAGLKITTLSRDNFLYVAGLRQGDVVNTINGTVVSDEASGLSLLRSAAQKGFSIQLGVTRGRTRRAMVYTLVKK